MTESGNLPALKNRSLLRPMAGRDPQEHPRAATPLELLYDLCFVVAIAQAAASLHHAISEGHAMEGAVWFGLVFFAIWWAWMGFAWFASGFDNDDPLYRIKVFVQIVGILVLAAGVPRAFEHHDFALITFGYAIMRIGLISQWLRAAFSDPSMRKVGLRNAIGFALLQVGWLALLKVPGDGWIIGWMILVPLELFVPWWADWNGKTPWHAHHIAERYGLLTIIVIGESVLAATVAIQSAFDAGVVEGQMASIVVGAPIILFTMWWLYFVRPGHDLLISSRAAFLWGYGHYLIFAAAAAAGAGLAVLVDLAKGKAHISAFWAGQALAIPVAAYILTVWLVHMRRRSATWALELSAVLLASLLILAAPLTAYPAAIIAGVLVALTALTVKLTHRAG